MPNDLLSPKAVARLLSVSAATVYRWVHAGELRAYRLAGSRYRISRADALAMLVQCGTAPEPPAPSLDARAASDAQERMRRAGSRA